MKVLLIEDDFDIFTILDILFQKEDIELVWAETAQEGMQIFEESVPDLVISDLGLPDVDGSYLIQAFKQISPTTPIILLTARNNEADKASLLASGVQEYIVKPFEAEAFVQKIKSYQAKL
jgi:DNA-binding response OmpR family regulator